jgi:hypothetical protein
MLIIRHFVSPFLFWLFFFLISLFTLHDLPSPQKQKPTGQLTLAVGSRKSSWIQFLDHRTPGARGHWWTTDAATHLSSPLHTHQHK